jgi:DNA (cytosine-5)-methyltransferase 1
VVQPVGVDIDNTNITGDCAGNILAGAQMRSNKGMGVMQATAQPVADVGPTIGSSGPPYSRTGNERVETDALAIQAMQVRRLTPVECERLQGFADSWTNIPWRGKSEAPDGPRYKALGNSMAVPVMRWIGERINA